MSESHVFKAMALKEEGRSSSGNGASVAAAGGGSSTSSSSTKMSNALRQREVGCDVHAILASMFDEQRDHNFSTFGETYLKYRKVVAEWMVDVCEYFTLHATTTHAAIAYLDRLQPNEKFSRFEWQMLAICCILIAAKYNECEDHVPDLSTLEDITQQSISNETVLNYELWALKRLGWKLNARTPMAFLASYLIFEEPSSDMYKKAQAMATTCMLDTRYKSFLASDVACAILYVTRKSVNARPVWGPDLSAETLGDPSRGVVKEIVSMLSEQTDNSASASSSSSSYSSAAASLSSSSFSSPLSTTSSTSSTAARNPFASPTATKTSDSSTLSAEEEALLAAKTNAPSPNSIADLGDFSAISISERNP